MKHEGFWYSEYEPDLPMPEPNVLTQDQADQIGALIKMKEQGAETTRYRGMSKSRLEKDVYVGCAEYTQDGWKWPAGFADHYVIKHRVKPTDGFLEFIGYEKPSGNTDEQEKH